MNKGSGLYPRVSTDTASGQVVSQAGGVLLVETVRAAGLDVALRARLAPWRRPLAVHDPAKILCDLAVALGLGGDCLADVALLRAEPGGYGRVASDPTVSRTIDALAADASAVLAAIDAARAAARERVWALAGEHAPNAGVDADRGRRRPAPLVVDLDATLVTAHSDKEQAAPTFKRGYGFHPVCAFVDHGPAGTGEPLSILLRPGNAGSNTAADHVAVTRAALRQLPQRPAGAAPGRQLLIRTDAAGGTHAFLNWLSERALSYSVGFTLPEDAAQRLALIPAPAWTPAYDTDGGVRAGAWVAEATGCLDRSGWPAGLRVIVRKERPHPGAQLRLTDADGHRLTAFATNTSTGQLAELELRHRRRARAEDRIRIAKDTGLTNLPLHDFAQNQIWCALVELACEITAWMQLLALTEHSARRWEPKRLRLRLFRIAGRLAASARRRTLHLPAHAPWAGLLQQALTTLRAPARPRLARPHRRCPPRPAQPAWSPAPTRATSVDLSHPHATITATSCRAQA